MATEASVEPLSHTTISPSMPAAAKVRWIFSMQGPMASSSLRHGITTETSGPPLAHSHRGRASAAAVPNRIHRMPPATSPAE